MGRPVRERGARPLPPSRRTPNPANDNFRGPRPSRPLRPLPVPLPANDNPLPGRAPRSLRLPPSAFRYAAARVLPFAGWGLLGLDLARDYIRWSWDYAAERARRKPSPPDWDLSGWRVEFGSWPLDFYKANWHFATHLSPANTQFTYQESGGLIPTSGSVSNPGWGASGATVEFWTGAAVRGRFYYATTRTEIATGITTNDRQYWHSSWVRDATFGPPSASPVPGRPLQWQIPYKPPPSISEFPNVVRNLPGVRPATQPSVEVGYFNPLTPKPQTPPRFNHARQPPPSNVSEKKTLNRAARIGIAGWKMLDTFSELTEIGGAFWDALPPDIRKKSGCKEGAFSIGQYGSDINACQLETLVENWDKIDTAEAFKNIAKNVVEDMTIGQFHKWLASMYPPGISFQRTALTHAASRTDAEAYIAKRLQELWDFLGI